MAVHLHEQYHAGAVVNRVGCRTFLRFTGVAWHQVTCASFNENHWRMAEAPRVCYEGFRPAGVAVAQKNLQFSL